MDYVVIGGDDRFACLAEMLAGRGKRVRVLGRGGPPSSPDADRHALADAANLVVNNPPRWNGIGPDLGQILDAARPDARMLLCGPKRAAMTDGRIDDLWADEALICENACLTAEGAVASAMRASACALRGMRSLVVGWGRIGRALTELLVALGSEVTVASRSPAGRNRAAERGAESVETCRVTDALPGRRLIFNTAPAMVFDGATLRRADPEAMLIDLASPPYGIDLRAAWNLSLRAWREPGLPGRYCPESAAKALLDAIERRGL